MPMVDATTAAKAATNRNGGGKSQTLNGNATISRSSTIGSARPLTSRSADCFRLLAMRAAKAFGLRAIACRTLSAFSAGVP